MFSQKNECIMRAAGKSAGQFPYLRLNELSGGSGKLIHPLNADEIVPVDRPCIGTLAFSPIKTAATRMPRCRSVRTSSAVSATPAAPS